jgi:hypothetical protein
MQDHCRRSFIPKSPTHLAVRRLAALADRPATCLDGRFDQALIARDWLAFGHAARHCRRIAETQEYPLTARLRQHLHGSARLLGNVTWLLSSTAI